MGEQSVGYIHHRYCLQHSKAWRNKQRRPAARIADSITGRDSSMKDFDGCEAVSADRILSD